MVPVVWLVDSLGCPWLFYCKVIFALYQWRVFLAVTGLSLKNVGCYIRDEQRIFPTGILKTILFWMLEQLTSPDRHLTTRPILFCLWFTFEASRGHRLGHLWAASVKKRHIYSHSFAVDGKPEPTSCFAVDGWRAQLNPEHSPEGTAHNALREDLLSFYRRDQQRAREASKTFDTSIHPSHS